MEKWEFVEVSLAIKLKINKEFLMWKLNVVDSLVLELMAVYVSGSENIDKLIKKWVFSCLFDDFLIDFLMWVIFTSEQFHFETNLLCIFHQYFIYNI